MIQCPKCGAMNPEGFRNCKECYHPFGMEGVLNGTGPPVQPPPPPQYTPGGRPPMIGDPISGKPAQVLAVRPIRKVPAAVWIMLAVLLVAVIFSLAWFLTHSSGSSSYLEGVFDNMERLTGWEADIRVDSSDYPVDVLSFYLGNSWEGALEFQGPDRFSLTANSLQSRESYGLRIIEGTLYELDSYSGVWRNLGPASEEQLGANPIWDTTFTGKLPISEGEGLQEVNGHMCKVLSFDKDVKMVEESMLGDYEIVYHYQGELYVDNSTDLLVAIDYIIEIPDMGRSHYRFDFHSLGSQTSIDVPPGALAPASGGG
ncbi:MAG: zinc ribbon domain-containing protein [Actinobacteria bacterium]|jgi:hypothetical protein|nr:MAG: zinc ribbon domain-containing protein [Actinomycetota bacterium]